MAEPKYLTTPEQFLDSLPHLPPGWTDEEGGLLEVIKRLGAFQQTLNNQAEDIAAIRTAAINELLKTHSGAQIGRELGLTRANISRLSRAKKEWSNPTW